MMLLPCVQTTIFLFAPYGFYPGDYWTSDVVATMTNLCVFTLAKFKSAGVDIGKFLDAAFLLQSLCREALRAGDSVLEIHY
jgi:hypothetical protein